MDDLLAAATDPDLRLVKTRWTMGRTRMIMEASLCLKWTASTWGSPFASLALFLLYLSYCVGSHTGIRKGHFDANEPLILWSRVSSPSRGQCLNEGASICQYSSNHRDPGRCPEPGSVQPSVSESLYMNTENRFLRDAEQSWWWRKDTEWSDK